MKNITYNLNNNLLNMALTLFALNSKSKIQKKSQIFWVIDESDIETAAIAIKYYNENNELIFEELINGDYNGMVDEDLIEQINQTKRNLIKA